MFRRVTLSLTLFAIAAVGSLAFGPVSTARADAFDDYAYAGCLSAYYGYLYNYETNRIAAENNFSNSATQSAVDYAYYSFLYAYYGLIYRYADYVQQGGELADASKEFAFGIFEYSYYTLYPEYPYPQVDAVVNNSFWGYYYMAFAESYCKAAPLTFAQ